MRHAARRGFFCGMQRRYEDAEMRMLMLNLTIRPGDYFTIGDEIRVVVLGGSKNNVKVMVDAPRQLEVVRGSVLEREAGTPEEREGLRTFYPEKPLSPKEIRRLIASQAK